MDDRKLLEDRIAELEAALRPFTYEADSISDADSDEDERRILVSVWDCRRAAAAMGEKYAR